MRPPPHGHLYAWVFLAACLLTACVYWPGMAGAYLFDDYSNIVENTALHVHSLAPEDWRRAWQSSPSPELRRPLAMLSFALNIYFTGLDPWPMKLTNLLIHLANGALLWAVLDRLLRFPGARLDPRAARWTAVGVAAAWLLSPINVSGVLYVVQRMEALGQTFVLAGLWLYLHGRTRMIEGRGGILPCASALIVAGGLGFLCKESAALLPLYSFLVELTVLRFAAAGGRGTRQLWALYGLILLLPVMAGCIFVLPRLLTPEAFAWRPFTLHERLLTECRVVTGYARAILLPTPRQLGFYHDDLQLSRGWLDPPSTLLCALLLAALAATAAALHRSAPLFALGVACFFAGHLLTATVIPLELVFEHRNYFPSAGLLLAAADVLGWLTPRMPRLRWSIVILAFAGFCTITLMRAIEWGNPIRFAYAEAAEHPDSPRAHYELGRTLLVASGYRQDSKLIGPAEQAFEQAARLPNAGAAPYAGLIVASGHMHTAVDAAWWNGLAATLGRTPPSPEDIAALQSIYLCQLHAECPTQTPELLRAFLEALSHNRPDARLSAVYGAFAANQLHDYRLAADMLSDAVALSPGNLDYRLELANVQVLLGDYLSATKIATQVLDMNPTLSQAEQAQSLLHAMP